MRTRGSSVLFSVSMVVTIMVVALTSGTSSAKLVQKSDGAPLRARLARALETSLADQRTPEHISGMSLRVTFRGNRPSIDVPVGTTTFGGDTRLSAHDLWQIGSNTKAFTAVMLLQLEAEGRLSIEDRLGKWLPRYAAWGKVTIKRLLNMTSGIPDYLNKAAFWRDYAADPTTEFSPRRLVSYAERGRQTHGWSYSNTNYILAGMILEKATRDSYGHQLRKRIIKPLGLRTMAYRTTRYPHAFIEQLPAGYFFDSQIAPMAPFVGQDMRRFNLSYGGAAGGIVSSLKDATRWERALYEGRMLPPEQQAELESLVSQETGKPMKGPSLGPKRFDPAGYGLGVVRGVFGGSTGLRGLGRFWQYEGETIGYRVLHFYLPHSGTVVVLAANSNPPDDADLLVDVAVKILKILDHFGSA